MLALAKFERNLVVVELHFETHLCHANKNSCLNGCGSDSGLVYDVVDKTHVVKRVKVFLSALALFIGRGACIILP